MGSRPHPSGVHVHTTTNRCKRTHTTHKHCTDSAASYSMSLLSIWYHTIVVGGDGGWWCVVVVVVVVVVVLFWGFLMPI